MIRKDDFTITDEMQPLKDYLQGKSSTVQFVETCREISSTEDAEFEIIEPKQLPNSEQNPEECDATEADSSTSAGPKINE